MNRFTDYECAQLSEKFVNLLRSVVSRDLGKLTAVRAFIPDYKMTLSVKDGKLIKREPRYFSCIDRRKHGKRRVFASLRDDGKRYYMFYVSPKTIRKLTRTYDAFDDKVKDALKDKWVVTDDGYTFKCLRQLVYHIVCIERQSKRNNRPPCGSNMTIWQRGSSFMEEWTKSSHSITCNEKLYGIELERFSVEKEIFNGIS